MLAPAGVIATIESRNDTGDNEISKPSLNDTRCVCTRPRRVAACSGENTDMTASVVCFGELLLRLNAPDRELLLQSGQLRVYVGGAEANVAVSLSRLGHSTSVVSVVPDGALGAACISELRRHGVSTEGIHQVPGRLGIYFMACGAGHRPSEIVYDRADSAFARLADESINWSSTLAGAQWLHISGITPALGARAAEATLRAARAARDAGVSVSFDCNYRAKLWEAWHGDPAKILREIVEQSDLVFADDRALALILGRAGASDETPAGGTSRAGSSSQVGESSQSAADRATSRFRTAAELALKAFPRVQRIACTVRTEHNVDRHDLSALLASRQALSTTSTYALEAIVDRIGTGDAFAAGLLHGLLTRMDEQNSLEFALAAACLKHSVPGDFNLVTAAQVADLLAGRGFAVRR
jgi:2-dehydro-3-deoxygluconokinase